MTMDGEKKNIFGAESTENATNPPDDDKKYVKDIYWTKRIIEIPFVAFFLSMSLGDSVYGNLIIYQTCTVVYNYNATTCNALVRGDEEAKDIESIVQGYSSKIIMYRAFVAGVFPALICLFLGPWSDTNGRKRLIIISSGTYCLSYVVTLIFCQIPTLHPLWFLVPVIPFAVIGGMGTLITGCFCYLLDITPKSRRSVRMVILEGAIFGGMLAGTLLGPLIYSVSGFTMVFSVVCVITLIATVYSCYMEESLPDELLKKCHLFRLDLVKDLIKGTLKRRPNYRRALIWMIMFGSAMGKFSSEGESAVTYLFVRQRLSWNLSQYSWLSAFNSLAVVLGMAFVSIVLQKFAKLEDVAISITSFVLSAIRSLITTFATEGWHLYLANVIGAPRNAYGACNRSLLSKIIPHEDTGKVVAMTTSLDTIFPVAAALSYSVLYQNTLDTFPGAFNLISVGIYIISIIFMIFVFVLLKRRPENIPGENKTVPVTQNGKV